MTMTDIAPEQLTDAQWQVVHAIARDLVGTDANELEKAIAYLRHAINQNSSDAGLRFFKYLKTFVSNGRQVGHSGKTLDYYRNIENACSAHLKHEESNAQNMLQILGWTSRLMRYCKVSPIGEIVLPVSDPVKETTVPESERQIEIKLAAQGQNFQIGDEVDAKVINIKGKEVTYEILGAIKLTVKEPKKFEELSVGKEVKVKVIDLRENGIPKRIKCVD